MWGIFRLFLALTVVVCHARLLQGQPLSAENPAFSAVEMFFAISGFVITRAVRRNYSDGPGGFVRFWQNRVLRLMPVYWVALALGLACASLPLGSSRLLGHPVGWEWLSQIFIVGQTGVANGHPGQNAPLGVSWTLAIEITYYFVMSAWAAKSRHNANLFLIASAGIGVVAMASVPMGDSYAGTLWESLPFAMGCRLAWSKLPAVPVAAWVAVALAGAYAWMAPGTTLAHYGAALMACGAVIACESASPSRLGRFMADLSYPVYIVQFPAMALLWRLHGWTFIIAAPFAALAGGIVINRLVEAPLGRIRARIRSPGTAPMTSPTQLRAVIPAPANPTQ